MPAAIPEGDGGQGGKEGRPPAMREAAPPCRLFSLSASQAEEGADERRQKLGRSDQYNFQGALLSAVSALPPNESRYGDNDQGFQNHENTGRQKKGKEDACPKGGKDEGQQAGGGPVPGQKRSFHRHPPCVSLLQHMRKGGFCDGFDSNFFPIGLAKDTFIGKEGVFSHVLKDGILHLLTDEAEEGSCSVTGG